MKRLFHVRSILSCIIFSIALTITLVGHASAQTATPQFNTPEREQIVADNSETIRQTKLMLSHVNFAAVAIELENYASAGAHIQSAISIADSLSSSDFHVLRNVRLKYGRIDYDIDGQDQSLYVPRLKDEFSMERVDEFLSSTNNDGELANEVKAVHAKIGLDLELVKVSLNSAQELFVVGNYSGASKALWEVYESALIEEEQIRYPLWAVHDNLKLVESFIDQNEHRKARLALKNAVVSLESYRNEAGNLSNSQEVAELEKQLLSFQQELDAVNPTTSQVAINKVSEWASKIRSWYQR